MSESQQLLPEHPYSDSDSEPDQIQSPPQRNLSPDHSGASSRHSSTSPAPIANRANGTANGNAKRQSSFAQPRPDGTPRTPNRVRFDFDERPVYPDMNGNARGPEWIELQGEDSMDETRYSESGDGERVQRLPLLTGIEAPAVTLATEDFDPEDHLESARPRSGMRSAFMNMANSIMCVYALHCASDVVLTASRGAGIIGQPYAFRNAGLISGTVLLVGLTIVVDWTIRLIVINSKLSGANSFQATVEHCFGKSGLVAISLAQWLLCVHFPPRLKYRRLIKDSAFGGMVAFSVIVGDTIPRVLKAFFPSLADTAFLWLLTDRRAVIVLLILGVSYPLSLYRDIAKASLPLCFHLPSLIFPLARQSQRTSSCEHDYYHLNRFDSVLPRAA
jgi:sodium-coupled neutral amino acid transporter 11